MRAAILKDTVLDSSTVSESLYSEYDYTGSTTYNSTDRVYVSFESDGTTPRTPHRIYEATATTTTYPPDNPSVWSDQGATNRWKMFDGSPTSQTINTTSIEVEVDSSDTSVIGLFNLVAAQVELTQIVEDELIIDGDCSSDSFTKGTGFYYDATDDEYDCNGSQTASTELYQEYEVTEDLYYQIKFTVKNYSTGNIAGLSGGDSGDNVAANGTYTQIIQAGSTTHCGVIADTDFVGSIDDISMKLVPKYEVINMDIIDGADYYEYFFSSFDYKQDLIWYYPLYGDSTLRVTITWKIGFDAACGLLVTGRYSELGLTQYQPTIGIIDYSIKSTDSFGNTILSQGSFAKRADVETTIDNNDVDAIRRKLAELRGIAALYDCNNEDSEFDSLVIYGFYEKFDIMIPNISFSTCNIRIQGLA